MLPNILTNKLVMILQDILKMSVKVTDIFQQAWWHSLVIPVLWVVEGRGSNVCLVYRVRSRSPWEQK